MNVSQQEVTVIKSEHYGLLEVTPDNIFQFTKGIVGFEQYHSYALIAVEDGSYYILHAVQGQLSFLLVRADQFMQDYGFRIDAEMVEVLGISSPEEVVVFLILNLIDDCPYVNLKAPILLAPNSRQGGQFVIHDQNYPIRFPLGRKENA